MISTWKALFLCLLLIANVYTQADLGQTCQSDSLMKALATGHITMDLIDSYNGGANKDVYRDLSSARFEKQEVLGHAFALTGFEGPCQTFYTLVIDKV